MNISDLADYRQAVAASTTGDLDTARAAYERLLQIAEDADDVHAISFLMQSLGDIEARDGKPELGHELHRRAIGQSPGIPLTLIRYASGLAKHFGLAEIAESQLQNAETMLESNLWNREHDSISRETYLQQIEQLRIEIGGAHDNETMKR